MAKSITYRVVRRKRKVEDDTGSWWDVAALPFRLLGLLFQPAMWILGFGLGLCLAPFIIGAMAIKVIAIGAALSMFIRPRSS